MLTAHDTLGSPSSHRQTAHIGRDRAITTTVKRLGLALAVALILPECRVHADLTWDFSYDIGPKASNIAQASGTLTTTDTPSGGPYTLTGITGTISYEATTWTITGLINPGGFFDNDNSLTPTSPYLSGNGLAFLATPQGSSTATSFLVFDDGGEYAQDSLTQVGTEVDKLFGRPPDNQFTLTPAAAVPEPSTAIVASLGAVAFIAYGCTRRRRALRRQAVA